MRPQRYGDMRKENANYAFKEEKTRLHRKQTRGQEREEETEIRAHPFDGTRQLN